MRESGQFFVAVIAITLLSFASAASVSAQNPMSPVNPPMASERFDNDRETLYGLFSANKRGLSPEQRERAYLAAREFMRRYGGDDDTYTKEAKSFIADYERGTKQYELYTAYSSKNFEKAFERGRVLLKNEPENFFVLSVLSEAGYENAQAGKATFNDETVDYLRRAIQLVETGKLSTVEPFKSIPAADGFLHLALGWFLKDKAPREAASAFTKAVQPQSPYETDALVYYRLGVAILKGEFAELSIEYNENFGAKRESPEQRVMFERIARAGDRAVDAFARSVALSDPKRPAGETRITPEFRDRVLAQLTALYKSLHNDSDAGLSELVAGVLSKPMP